MVATNLGTNEMWKEEERLVMFKFLVITLQWDMFTMKKIQMLFFNVYIIVSQNGNNSCA
jgi:hypothetical protein